MACGDEGHKNKETTSVDSKIDEFYIGHRTIRIWGEVSDESMKAASERLEFIDATPVEEGHSSDITIIVNSPGGVITSGLAFVDTMKAAVSDIVVVCIGQAASMGAVILSQGTKGKRYASATSRVMIHQPLISGVIEGRATDIMIQDKEMNRMKEIITKLMADSSNITNDEMAAAMDEDNFMEPEDALKMGLIDHVGLPPRRA